MLEVVQGQEAKTGVKEHQPGIFTNYHIEENLLNGRVHYTSMDGTTAIAYHQGTYNNEQGGWNILPVEDRY